MKRCPECLFIYPETDVRCDFDNTALVVVNDAELEAATQPPSAKPPKRTSKKRSSTPTKRSTKPSPTKPTATKRTPAKRPRKATLVISIIGFVLGGLLILVYFTLGSRTPNSIEPLSVASLTNPHPIIVSPAPAETGSPSPTPPPTPKQTPERIATSHSRTTAAPISTSGPGIGKNPNGRPVIVLTSGGKIDADEVWRTRDGVWYRRNGIVTLLKHNRVKSISNQ